LVSPGDSDEPVGGAPLIGVVGTANVDITVRCSRLPAPGETVVGVTAHESIGGKGANQAAAAVRLGAAATLVACVGQDRHGEQLRQSLRRAGVDTRFVTTAPGPTGLAMIAVDERGENQIVVASGANAALDPVGAPIEEFDIVLAQLELPHVLDEVARRSRRLVLNASPFRQVDEETLDRCDVVVLNEHEAAALPVSRIGHCVVTMGRRGALLLEHGVEVDAVSAPNVDVVDTVGAGDVVCAAMAVRLVSGDDLGRALRYAVTAGSLATRTAGAQGALPSHEEVLEWLERAS
jgi:ribokinase